MKKFCFLCVVLSFLFSENAFSQDERFSNSNQSLLEVNPSFAGSNGCIRDQFIYGTQKGRSSETVSSYNGLDGYVKALRGGLGLMLANRNEGSGMLRTSSANLIYAPRFSCSKSGLTVVPSIQLTYLERSFDASKLTFASLLYEASIVSPQQLTSSEAKLFDASAGLLVNYKRLYVGAAVFHINQPDDGLVGSYKLPVKYSFNASYNLTAGKNMQLNFQVMYAYQNKYSTVQTGINALFFKHVIVGAGASPDEREYLSLGYRHNYFSLLFSYVETPVYHRGGYEACASFNLRNKSNREVVTNFENW